MCPYIDVQQKTWSIFKVYIHASKFGLKAVSSPVKICIKGEYLPISKVQNKSGFTYFRPRRKSLIGVPSISGSQFMPDTVKFITKNSLHASQEANLTHFL